VKVNERKFCSQCNEPVSKTSRKIIKIGKEEKLIDAALLANVLEQLEAVEEIHITQVSDTLPSEVERRYERLLYGDVVKKKEEDYATLRAYLGEGYGYGYGVFGHNKFGIVAHVEGPVIMLRKLMDESQLVDIDAERIAKQTTQQVDPELIELGRQAIDRVKVQQPDFTQFKDERLDMEEQLIEQLIDGKLPELKPAVTEKLVEDKKAKLRKLLEKTE
jgi:hypothetical protein